MKAFEIVIPCKRFTAGKSRLSPVLSPAARARLCRGLFRHTVQAALQAVGAGHVAVVSADAEVLALASRLGARTIAENGQGLDAAIHGANALLTALRTLPDGAPAGDAPLPGLIVLPIDLPLISAGLLRRTAEQVETAGIAPDAARTGTNLMVLSGGLRRDFPFAYGPESFDLHRRAARARGVEPTVIRHDRLAFDLDRPEDLATWRKADRGLSSILLMS
jgi:2-phospho-L-lactate guanylyltransferase